MLVLAAVPKVLQRRLDPLSASAFRFVTAESWTDAVGTILREPVEVAVVDPALEDIPRAHEVERMRVLFPSLPIILYTRLAPHIAPVLLRLGHAQIRHVIIAFHEDHPAALRAILSEEAARGVTHRLLDEFADLLSEWPEKLRWAVETIIREPADIQTVKGLAERAQMDRRTCLRWFDRANLPSPSVTLMALRVVYAHRLLQDPGYTIENVATKLGYSTRTFAQNVKEVFGMTPGELRVSLSPERALGMVRERYLSPQSAVPAASAERKSGFLKAVV